MRLLIYTSQSNVVYRKFSERIDTSQTSASLEKLRVNSSFFLNSLCHSADMCMSLGCSRTPDFPNLKRVCISVTLVFRIFILSQVLARTV